MDKEHPRYQLPTDLPVARLLGPWIHAGVVPDDDCHERCRDSTSKRDNGLGVVAGRERLHPSDTKLEPVALDVPHVGWNANTGPTVGGAVVLLSALLVVVPHHGWWLTSSQVASQPARRRPRPQAPQWQTRLPRQSRKRSTCRRVGFRWARRSRHHCGRPASRGNRTLRRSRHRRTRRRPGHRHSKSREWRWPPMVPTH